MADDGMGRTGVTGTGTSSAAGPGPGPAPGTGPRPAPAASSATGDWASETADRLDQLVTTIRSQTTDRILWLARLLVFGLLAAIMGVMALVLVVVALVRAIDELVPQEVWLAYLIVGAIFTLAGLFLWSKKNRRPSNS
ncbi:MAG: phage holin family protein [Acidimicrobiales bacterium]